MSSQNKTLIFVNSRSYLSSQNYLSGFGTETKTTLDNYELKVRNNFEI